VRIPTDSLGAILKRFPLGNDVTVLGACSFEIERSVSVLRLLRQHAAGGVTVRFARISPISDGFPDHRAEVIERTGRSADRVKQLFATASIPETKLLATPDELLDLSEALLDGTPDGTVVLDISCWPKRFFCFLVSAYLRNPRVRGLVATYTPVSHDGYSPYPLAEDPMPAGFLPGFAAPLPPKAHDIVVSLGFESLGCASIIEEFLSGDGRLRILVPFPPHPASLQRTWGSLRAVSKGQTHDIRSSDVEIVSAIDCERVFDVLSLWKEDAADKNAGLLLAPFGPKPHTLGMALFCIANSASGLIYTQPRAYNPAYSHSCGSPTGYVLKWDGVPCDERT
jgi:hypothetical protein